MHKILREFTNQRIKTHLVAGHQMFTNHQHIEIQ